MVIGQFTTGTSLYCISHEMVSATKMCLRIISYLLIYTKICIIWIVYVRKNCTFARIRLILDWYNPQTCFCALFTYVTVTLLPHSSNTTRHPALHNLTTDTSECDNIPWMTCPYFAVLGNSGMSSSCLR